MDRVHKEVHGLGLKTGLKNDNFWSEIGLGFREPGGAQPHQEFPGVSPRASCIVTQSPFQRRESRKSSSINNDYIVSCNNTFLCTTVPY